MPSFWAQSLFLGQIEQKIESILQLLSISCFKKENYLCYETALLTTNTLGQTSEQFHCQFIQPSWNLDFWN